MWNVLLAKRNLRRTHATRTRHEQRGEPDVRSSREANNRDDRALRMTVENWRRFDPPFNKKTTIRAHPLRVGVHRVWTGSYYKSVLLGYALVPREGIRKLVRELEPNDAIADGFNEPTTFIMHEPNHLFMVPNSLSALLIELAHRNPELTLDTPLWINPIRKITKKEYEQYPKHIAKTTVKAIVKELTA